ncbi:MAG: helicase [Prevotella sp.]|nr:helicase [Prevotella sp.]
MKNEQLLIQGEALGALQTGTLEVELFLRENYLFRRNVLNGKVEFATKPAEGQQEVWKKLTPSALNSIVIRAKREQICEKGSPKTDIVEFVNSDEVDRFDPIADYLEKLPQWDGENHVAKLFNRLPGVDSELTSYLATWLRSVVAHWLQMDTIHGNECVPTLIGPQGCGKTTFVVRLLPPHLREYYLDHLNLSNKFDKEMALTNNLLVNLDELDAIRPSQHSALKQTLSKNKVNGRPIYGGSQEDRPRYASFIATTNNPHPLTDPTGSRRYICLTIPDGKYIDNSSEIDYDQLYAQVLYELRVQKSHYWFDNSEVERIQQLNQNYLEQKDIADIIGICFRKPEPGELPQSMNCERLLQIITKEYPSVKATHGTKVYLGKAMRALGFESTDCGHVAHYKVIPLKAA